MMCNVNRVLNDAFAGASQSNLCVTGPQWSHKCTQKPNRKILLVASGLALDLVRATIKLYLLFSN